MHAAKATRTIRKAVIPVAGPGSSLLPATRVIPKALLPIVDKPLAEFAVDEAIAAGIEQIIFVTARHDVTIEDHFANWHSRHAKRVTFASVRQFEARGLIHAIGCTEPLLDGEPFAVLLPDELILERNAGLHACIDMHRRTGHSVVATTPITRERTSSCAVVATLSCGERNRVTAAIDRPGPDLAPSLTGLVGRYVLSPAIFDVLSTLPPREARFAEALQRLLAVEPIYAIDVEGGYIDCGTRGGLVEAMLEVASRDPELAPALMRWRDARSSRPDLLDNRIVSRRVATRQFDVR